MKRRHDLIASLLVRVKRGILELARELSDLTLGLIDFSDQLRRASFERSEDLIAPSARLGLGASGGAIVCAPRCALCRRSMTPLLRLDARVRCPTAPFEHRLGLCPRLKRLEVFIKRPRINRDAPLIHRPDGGRDCTNKGAVMAHEKERSIVAPKRLGEAIAGVEIKMVGRLIH